MLQCSWQNETQPPNTVLQTVEFHYKNILFEFLFNTTILNIQYVQQGRTIPHWETEKYLKIVFTENWLENENIVW